MPLPVKDLDAIKIMARHLKRGPRTIKQLSELMSVSKRTVYRWLRHLEDDGHDLVARRKPNQPGLSFYSILK